ncbi:hypothetical protein V7152_09755 [Neobacillus drentensis]|uniref:hypothetical protein n=1 Tax=Neobacillus drentensis TaxID=220684 RepID=UPI0030009E8A
MKGKFVLALGFAGVLALSIGFAKELQSTEVSSEKQPKLEEVVTSKQTDTYKLVTREEQDRRESMIAEGKDVYTVITVEEQEMVENLPAQSGLVPQENGTGFFFTKEK